VLSIDGILGRLEPQTGNADNDDQYNGHTHCAQASDPHSLTTNPKDCALLTGDKYELRGYDGGVNVWPTAAACYTRATLALSSLLFDSHNVGAVRRKDESHILEASVKD